MTDNLLFFDADAPVQANQYAAEFGELLRMLELHPPRRVLEIGSFLGGSLYQWIRRMPRGGRVVAVDLPGAHWGMPDTAAPGDWRAWGLARDVRVFPVLEDSHRGQTVAQVHNFAPFDFMFVDGDHSYEGVKTDWNYYRYMVPTGGMVAFHDILHNPDDEQIGVWKLWEEIRGGYTHRELTSFDGQSDKGIGILWT